MTTPVEPVAHLDVGTLAGDETGTNRAIVEDIHALARSCTDTVPFLLVPVRIETRFWQAEDVAWAGPSATAQLATTLAAAAALAEQLAATDFATTLPPGTRTRRDFKRDTEIPLVNGARDALTQLAAHMGHAAQLARDLGDATPDDLTSLDAATARLTAALPSAAQSLTQLRSAHQRVPLQDSFAAIAQRADTIIATARAVAAPAAALFTQLRTSPGSRIAFTPDGSSPLIARPGATIQLPRSRLVDSATAYARLQKDLAALLESATATVTATASVTGTADPNGTDAAASSLAGAGVVTGAADPIRAHTDFDAAQPRVSAGIADALAQCTAIAVLPAAWGTDLLDEIDVVHAALRAAARPVQDTRADAVAATEAGMDRLRAAALALASSDLGPVLTVPATATHLVDQLRVRIFPDDIAVRTHEEPRTTAEQDAGATYWHEAAAHGGDEPAHRAAWRALVARYGSPRAAWIVRQTRTAAQALVDSERFQQALGALRTLAKRLDEVTPSRFAPAVRAFDAAIAAVSALPALPEPAAARLREASGPILARSQALPTPTDDAAEAYHTVEQRAGQLRDAVEAIQTAPLERLAGPDGVATRDSAWTVPPTAGLLPERFVVITVQGDKVTHVVAGAEVNQDLTLGPDPRPENAEAETVTIGSDGSLSVGPSLRWMIDYDTAVSAGMAITVPITAAEATAGFDRVYVLGISGTDPADGQRRLTEILDAHHYAPGGLALVPNGSATNARAGRPPAYRSDDDADDSFDVELGTDLVTADSDGQRLASAFGVTAELFNHIEHAGGADIAEAIAANTALWPATVGYALEELLGRIVGLDAQDLLREFALTNVLGRGSLPAIRVGPQPYGVLTTTAFTRYAPDGGGQLPAGDPVTLPEADQQRRFEILLRDVLLIMHRDWTRARAAHVQHAYSTGSGQPHVLDVLGLDAVSRSYEQRFAVNAGRRGMGVGPYQLHVGIPPETAAATEGMAGPFALLERFAPVIAAANRLAVTTPIDRSKLLVHGLVTPPFAPVYDRLDASRGYEVRYLDNPVGLGGALAADTSSAALSALLAADLEDLARDAAKPQTGQTLLTLLARQALLVTARDVALRLLELDDDVSREIRAEVGSGELFQVSTLKGRRNVTRWSFLLARLSDLSGTVGPQFHGPLYNFLTTGGSEQRMHQFLNQRGDNTLFTGFAATADGQQLLNTAQAPLQRLREHGEAVAELSSLTPDRQRQLTAEHLDLCSHRLDAWLLGLAAARRDRMRATTDTGVHLGAFGWVEELRPAASHQPAQDVPAVLDQDPRSVVRADTTAGGFVHAPSLAHASAAAILRAGYLAHGPRPGLENRMAVNVSSRRVAAALRLADGIAAGNDLGALLGADFERDLHSAVSAGVVLDDLIPDLRTAFPSVIGVTGPDDTADRHVVDGARLLNVVRAYLHSYGPANAAGTLYADLVSGSHQLYPYGLTSAAGLSLLPPTTQPARLDAILHAIDRLADTVDALADLYLAEGVFQLVEGNSARAAAVLSALGEGRLPPRPDIIDTPVTGTRVSHRVLVHLEPTTELPDGWTAPSTRAAAEPTLNRWLAELLGPPGRTRVAVVGPDLPDGSPGPHVSDLTLTALALQPIDLLAILHGGMTDGVRELGQRVLDALRPVDVRDGEPTPPRQLSLERGPDWPTDVRSLGETAALIESVVTVLRNGRAAQTSDYVLADSATGRGGGTDDTDLDGRVTAAAAALSTLGARLIGLLSDGATNDTAILTGNIGQWIADHADTYRGAVPPEQSIARLDAFWLRREDFRAALIDALGFGISGAAPPTQWTTRDQVARAMLDAAELALVEVARRHTTAAGLEGLDAMRALFGPTLPVLPHIRLTNRDEIAAAIAADPADEPELAVQRWLAGVSAVRPTLAAWTTACALGTAFGAPIPAAVPAQLPTREHEPWLGESAPIGPGDRVSLVLFAPHRLATDGGPSAAWLLDEWTELIPADQVTTGVTFNYDQPDAAAPQAILLAVPPSVRGHWQWEDLVQTLHDTFELACNRAVEPAHLQNDLYGQLLPALIGDIAPLGAGGGLSDHRVVLDFGYMQPPKGSS